MRISWSVESRFSLSHSLLDSPSLPDSFLLVSYSSELNFDTPTTITEPPTFALRPFATLLFVLRPPLRFRFLVYASPSPSRLSLVPRFINSCIHRTHAYSSSPLSLSLSCSHLVFDVPTSSRNFRDASRSYRTLFQFLSLKLYSIVSRNLSFRFLISDFNDLCDDLNSGGGRGLKSSSRRARGREGRTSFVPSFVWTRSQESKTSCWRLHENSRGDFSSLERSAPHEECFARSRPVTNHERREKGSPSSLPLSALNLEAGRG